jgi:molybdate transport system substrate-binding protein
MKKWGAVLAMSFGLLVASTQASMVRAAEIKVFAPRAVWTLLAEIGPEFERTTGHKLNVINGYSPVYMKQIRAGEPFDVVVSIRPLIDPLFKDGTLISDSDTNIVRTGTGVEVRAGAAKPDIGSVEAFKRAMLNAKSIAYLRIAGVPELMERLGIADAIKSKVTIPETDIVSELVAEGKIELGIPVITQILTTPGVELVGPLPAEIQIYIQFVAGVSAKSKAPGAAKDLIKYINSPIALPAIKSQWMEPAGP